MIRLLPVFVCLLLQACFARSFAGCGCGPHADDASSGTDAGDNDATHDTWIPMSDEGAPTGRWLHTAIWTGSELLIWGGRCDIGGGSVTMAFADGGAFDPGANSWRSIPSPGFLSSRFLHRAVWTGTAMIVWGGRNASALADGAIFDPVADLWTPISDLGAPSPRWGAFTEWTGTKMIVWGGLTRDSNNSLLILNDGSEYDPSSDTWTPVSSAASPPPPIFGVSAWTGAEMLLWGAAGEGAPGFLGRYDPNAGSWETGIAEVESTILMRGAWSGEDLYLWEGLDFGGGRYRPSTDRWYDIDPTGAPDTIPAAAAWVGSRFMIWGGIDSMAPSFSTTSIGATYDPLLNLWAPTTLVGAPSPRDDPSLTAAGAVVLAWGGQDDGFNCLSSGGIYYP